MSTLTLAPINKVPTGVDQASRMRRRVGQRDTEKLDEYFTAVRETEQRLVKAESWEQRPKPKVDYNTNMPILLAGGGFKHGQHLAFDPKNNYPLPNLFVSMLQRMSIETDKFATSTGTMRGLEWEWRTIGMIDENSEV